MIQTMNASPEMPPEDIDGRITVPLTDGDIEQYRLRAPLDIASALQAVVKSGMFITVYFNGAKDFLLTTLLGITPNGAQIVLDVGGNALMNKRAVEARDIICVTTVDKVRIQFELSSLSLVSFKQRPAFSAPLPKSVLRLQRRSYYRLIPPPYPSLKCTIPNPDPTASTAVVEARVNDISVGGISLSFPAHALRTEYDAELAGCRIDLPELGTLDMTLKVRNAADIPLRNGTAMTRIGCQFAQLTGAQEKLIQKFIFNADRHRKAGLD